MPRHLPLVEFAAMMGVMLATVAFSIDSMLPAMTGIAAELTPDQPNQAQLIITSFLLGLGLGTLFTGPLSDRFGRKPVIVIGALVYGIGAVLAWWSATLEGVLLARVLQGLGAAGPRVAALAIVRDLYSGRRMAQVMSFAMIVFALVPAAAPLIGSWIIWGFGWRGIFVAFLIFMGFAVGWLGLRQAETLAPADSRAFSPVSIMEGTVEILKNRQVMLVVAILSLVFAVLYVTLSTAQQIFEFTYGRADSFPYWFGAVAILSGMGNLLNARIVMRLGMRRVVAMTLAGQIGCSAIVALIVGGGMLTGDAMFYVFVAWLVSLFLVASLCIGNLNALGMEPLGHLAGLGASVIGSISTIAAVAIAIPIGLAFDGTPFPVAIGILGCCALALWLMRGLERVEVSA